MTIGDWVNVELGDEEDDWETEEDYEEEDPW